PLDWASNWANGLPLLLVGWPLLIAHRLVRRERDRVELLTCAAFTALAFTGSRFVSTYALAAAPYVARDVAALAQRIAAPRLLHAPWARATAIAVLSVGAGLFEWTHFESPLGMAFDERRTPVHACDFVAAHGIRGRSF